MLREALIPHENEYYFIDVDKERYEKTVAKAIADYCQEDVVNYKGLESELTYRYESREFRNTLIKWIDSYVESEFYNDVEEEIELIKKAEIDNEENENYLRNSDRL